MLRTRRSNRLPPDHARGEGERSAIRDVGDALSHDLHLTERFVAQTDEEIGALKLLKRFERRVNDTNGHVCATAPETIGQAVRGGAGSATYRSRRRDASADVVLHVLDVAEPGLPPPGTAVGEPGEHPEHEAEQHQPAGDLVHDAFAIDPRAGQEQAEDGGD